MRETERWVEADEGEENRRERRCTELVSENAVLEKKLDTVTRKKDYTKQQADKEHNCSIVALNFERML